jgi:hypothetical protein
VNCEKLTVVEVSSIDYKCSASFWILLSGKWKDFVLGRNDIVRIIGSFEMATKSILLTPLKELVNFSDINFMVYEPGHKIGVGKL